LVGIKKKVEKREAKRELKAEAAARLDHVIEQELLERLKKGIYDDSVMNERQEIFTKALESLEDAEEDIEEDELEEEEEVEDFDEVRFNFINTYYYYYSHLKNMRINNLIKMYYYYNK